MNKLAVPFTVFNKQWKREFLIMYTNLAGDFIDENKVVHEPEHLVYQERT